MPIKPLLITACTVTSALGRGLGATYRALLEENGGLRPCDFEDASLETWIGRVEGLEDEALPKALEMYECRNNRLAYAGLQNDNFMEAVQKARTQYGKSRIGVFLGTSTSAIHATELAYRKKKADSTSLDTDYNLRYRYTHNMYSCVDFARHVLDLHGPALAISTACTSSAKVFATAYRYMRSGLCDAVVVGGVDSLCHNTLYGFNSLEVVAPTPCQPWGSKRNGMNIGEAAGYALLEWASAKGEVALLGYGESSDAYHMSSPHPEGKGAAKAMQDALKSSGLNPHQIDYINLHGTATPANDNAEDKAITSVFGTSTPCSSTKGWTGHTLGASGIVEAVFSYISIQYGFMPATLNTLQIDEQLNANVLLTKNEQTVRTVLSNSFGFGGSNCSLLFGRIL